MPTNLKMDKLLHFVISNPGLSSSKIYSQLNLGVELLTVKRYLSKLVSQDYLVIEGKGRGTKYYVSSFFKLSYPIDMDKYFEKEVDEREIETHFNFSLIDEVLLNTKIFTTAELAVLTSFQKQYLENIKEMSHSVYQHELERLGIDLSWKSSQIEGNTYSLLETEQLLKELVEAKGKKKEEATMLINHKVALDYIIGDSDYFLTVSIKKIEEVHSLLTNNLDVEKNIRKRIVGITGTNYKPLDNEHQIKEVLNNICRLVNSKENIFEKSFLILLLLSYLQAFADGNKRTARIISNAVLISNNHCPISFRSVDSIDYKKAMLIFYEQNNIQAFKQIFIEQYKFAVNTYFQ